MLQFAAGPPELAGSAAGGIRWGAEQPVRRPGREPPPPGRPFLPCYHRTWCLLRGTRFLDHECKGPEVFGEAGLAKVKGGPHAEGRRRRRVESWCGKRTP